MATRARGARGLPLSDVRAMLRAGNDLHRHAPDPAARKRRLLEGMCRLVPADSARAVVARLAAAIESSAVSAKRLDPAQTGGARILSTIDLFMQQPWRPAGGEPLASPSGGIPPLAAPPWWRLLRKPGSNARDDDKDDADRAGAGVGGTVVVSDRCLHSLLTIPLPPAPGAAGAAPAGRVGTCVTLARGAGDRHPFSPRDMAVAHLLHGEMSWVYEADLLLACPHAMSLSPRQRQTLEHLLGDSGEKQIAARLGVSPHTVHHYVKVLYRHFGVSSRSELLARWIRRDPPAPG